MIKHSWLHRHLRGFNRYTVAAMLIGGFLSFLVTVVFILRVDVQTHYFGILPQGKVPKASAGHQVFYDYTSEQLETIHNSPYGTVGYPDSYNNKIYENDPKVKREIHSQMGSLEPERKID